jgi:hypothetical protein
VLVKRTYRHARLLGSALALAASLVLAAVGAGPARADAAPYVAWSTYLPGWTDAYVPSSANDCVAGRPVCLRQTRKELGRILTETAHSCSHDAVFALAYTRITQTYAWSRDIPGYYQDLPYMNHMDTVFAKYYTDAYYNYRGGRRFAVPRAWLLAFDAARDKLVTGVGDLLLGMNAHINRDLPFVLAATGLVKTDGSSGKADYDKVEQFLNDASEAMLAEAAVRFDPTIDDADDPLGAAYGTIFQIISAARENAWRNAEALVSARNSTARAVVAAGIEAQANAAAHTIVLAQAYVPPVTTTSVRDRYCSTHKGDAAPLSYPFGMPTPYGS